MVGSSSFHALTLDTSAVTPLSVLACNSIPQFSCYHGLSLIVQLFITILVNNCRSLLISIFLNHIKTHRITCRKFPLEALSRTRLELLLSLTILNVTESIELLETATTVTPSKPTNCLFNTLNLKVSSFILHNYIYTQYNR